MKRWLTVGLLLLAMVIGALFYLYTNIGSLIVAAVEKYGSEITRTEVRLKAAEISARSGHGALRGLSVSNPEGFKTPRAFELGEISVTLDVATLTSDPVVIREIVVSAPRVTYELGPRGSNLDAIKRNVDTYTRSRGSAPQSEETAGGRRLVIENLYIRNGVVEIGSGLSGKTMTASLPDLHLTDIGRQKNGVTPGELTERVIDALRGSVNRTMAGLDTSKILDDAEREVAGATAALEEQGKTAAGGIKRLFGR